MMRSVSIIGVGCTPFGNTSTTPAIRDLTEQELFSWAAINAMEDAGVEGKDLELLLQGQVGNIAYSNAMTPAVTYQDWVGMHGACAIHHEEACGTGYVGFNLGVMAVASGACDFVLTGGVELMSTKSFIKKPNHIREVPSLPFKVDSIPNILADPCFSRFPSNIAHNALFAYPPADYIKKYGLTGEELDDVCNALALHGRRGAARNPLAAQQTEFAQLTREAGLEDVMDYLRDDRFNPMGSMHPYRKLHGITPADGAAVLILCPTEMAHRFRQQPIEVLGISGASMDTRHPRNEAKITEMVCRQVYRDTGVKPEEVDLFQSQDLQIFDQIESAEIAGYLPHGEGWRAAMEGRTAFDGDRPINTNGGRASFGHAFAAAGLADVGEVVLQMRGQAGTRQVGKLPETAMVRGIGGGQNATAAILRTAQ